MKIKLLSLIFFVVLSANAQTTHNIDWLVGVGTVDLTIEVGDTVIWTWKDLLPHTVESTAGSVETFDSGLLFNEEGMPEKIYSKTFTVIGTNPYKCLFHELSMNGTITVEAVMGIDKVTLNEFSISPNPGRDRLNLKLSRLNANTSLEVFDVLGKKIYANRLSSLTTSIDVFKWNSGVYLVRITNDSGTQTKRFVKQ